MKIHLQQKSEVAYGYYRQAIEAWDYEGLIPDLERKCDGLMMKKGNEKYFTDDIDKVTCKRCIKMWIKSIRVKYE